MDPKTNVFAPVAMPVDCRTAVEVPIQMGPRLFIYLYQMGTAEHVLNVKPLTVFKFKR